MDDEADVFPVSLREHLPNIPIPLRPADQDVVLQLQPLLDESYRRGRYDTIDYRVAADPPLAADDNSWANQLLCEQGLRP